MSVHPIDFQASIMSAQRVEKVQSNSQEHNFVIQSQIAHEMKRQIEQQKNQVVFIHGPQPGRIKKKERDSGNKKKRGKKRKAFMQVKLYTFKKKAMELDSANELDVEA